jgi:hypothetical protein
LLLKEGADIGTADNENLSQDELFITSLCPSVHLICLALRGGQISVVDEGQGKKVSLVLFLSCAIFLHTHVSVQPQQRDTSLANIFP